MIPLADMAPLLIAGFHRSGTSAVARLFHRAGVHLGDELLGAEPANPHGHFEDLSVIEMHDRFLARAGRTWKSVDGVEMFPDESVSELRSLIEARDQTGIQWGVKDPRLCLFLSEWLREIPDARIVVVVRRPGSAVRSLHMRHSRRHVDTRGVDASDLDFWRTPDLGLRLWVHYHQKLISALDAHARLGAEALIVDYDNRPAMSRLIAAANDRWGMTLATQDDGALDPSLGTATTRPIEVRSEQLLTDAVNMWSTLQKRISVI